MSTIIADSKDTSSPIVGERPLKEGKSRVFPLFFRDVAAAAISATLVAPIVTIIDRLVQQPYERAIQLKYERTERSSKEYHYGNQSFGTSGDKPSPCCDLRWLSCHHDHSALSGHSML